MKLKIIKTGTLYDIVNGTNFDIKRDGGFWTCQTNFIASDKNLLKRYDRIEINEYQEVSLPLAIRIFGTDRNFTTNQVTFTSGGNTYTIIISLTGNTLTFVTVNASLVIDDEIIIIPTSVSVSRVSQGTDILWSGNQIVGASSQLNLETVILSTTQWLVAKAPRIRLNYDDRWVYNVALVEPNKILTGQVLPNISFTQPLISPTITLAEMLTRILKKHKTRTWANRNTTDFTLSSLGANKLNIVAKDDIFIGKTLFDICERIGKQIDAFPKIVNWTEIDFEYINQSTTTIAPDLVSIELSEDIEDFATELIMDAENVDLGGDLSYYPNKLMGTYVIPENLNDETSNANATIELPFKVKKVYKIVGRAFSPPDEDFPDDIPAQVFEYEYYEGDGFVEKSVWENLPKTTFWADTWTWLKLPVTNTKNTTAYYTYGDNKIHNIGALKNYAGTTDDVYKLTYSIWYEPLAELQIVKSNDIVLDGGLSFSEYVNQDERSVNKVSAYNKMKSDITNKASTTASIRYKSTTFPTLRSRIIVLGETYVATRFLIEKQKGYYDVNVTCSSIFNKTSQFVAVDREPRKYEIPSNQVAQRVVRYPKKYKISVSSISTSVQAVTLTPTHLSKTGILSFLYPLCKNIILTEDYKKGSFIAMCQFNYVTEYEGSNAIAMVVQTEATFHEDRVSLIFKPRDNVNNDFFKRFNTTIFTLGNQVATTEAVSAIYTDENGELESVDVKLIPITEEEQLQELSGSLLVQIVQEFLRYTYPLVPQTYFEEGYELDGKVFSAIDLTGDNRLYLDKDRREALIFQLDFDLEGDTGVVIYDGFTENTAFIKDLQNGTDVVMTLLTNIGEIAVTYTSATILTDRLVIDFTPSTGGQNRDVTDIIFRIDGNIILTKTLPSVVTVTNQNYKITIGIGE
jgi:hypothetical protein